MGTNENTIYSKKIVVIGGDYTVKLNENHIVKKKFGLSVVFFRRNGQLILGLFVELIIYLFPLISLFSNRLILPYNFLDPFPSIFSFVLVLWSLQIIHFSHHIHQSLCYSLDLFITMFKTHHLCLFFVQVFT